MKWKSVSVLLMVWSFINTWCTCARRVTVVVLCVCVCVSVFSILPSWALGMQRVQNLAHVQQWNSNSSSVPCWGWINFEFEFKFEFEFEFELPPRFPVQARSGSLSKLLSQVWLWDLTEKGCRCAQSPLLTEIRWGLMLRGVARCNLHVHWKPISQQSLPYVVPTTLALFPGPNYNP